jgi:benzoate/toluate 1,2-dioxygenase alpha subunit
MGTPDDLEEFRACQNGYQGAPDSLWNDLSRGAMHWIDGPDDNACAMGLTPLMSGIRSEDEGLFVRQHGYWAKALQQGLASDQVDADADLETLREPAL